jgi:hypothetical protein
MSAWINRYRTAICPLPPRPNSAHQETSQTCLIRGVVGFMRKIDERIEPLSPDKRRGIVPFNAQAGAA